MSTFLFAAHPATGHVNPLLAIARKLAAAGHEVVFACSAPAPASQAVLAQGFRLVSLPPSRLLLAGALLLPRTSGFLETCVAVKVFTRGLAHYADALARWIDEVEPAAVVADFTFPGAGLAADLRGVPWVAVYHAGLSFPGPGIPPFGSGLAIGADWGLAGSFYRAASDWLERGVSRAIRRARRQLGLPEAPAALLARPASKWLNLVLTAEALEAPRDPLPKNTFFVGPCIDADRGGPADFPFERLDPSRPKVYASLGTVFNDRPAVFRRILDAFADGGHQLVVAAGAAFGRLPSAALRTNAIVVRSAPQLALLPRVDAVIGHGGNNTTNETLAAGKPLLVLPVGGEQGDNASRVVHLGAGLRAEIGSARSDEIRAKVDRLLGEPEFGRRARQIAEEVARTDGPGTAARLLGQLALSRAPVFRPPGAPLTVAREAPV